MAATQDGILMLWLLPLAAVGGGAYLSLLTDHDIDWYLSERPPAFWIAIGTGTVRPGLDTHVWTVNDEASMARMIERGVNNIITDEPALLRRVIEERAALSDGELLLLALSARLRE